MLNAEQGKQRAIQETKDKTKLTGIDWEATLHQVETWVLNNHAHPTDAAEDIFQKIIQNNKFTIALVFNPDHTQVKAVPLPEEFENKTRVDFASWTHASYGDIFSITRSVEAILAEETNHPTSSALHNVIVIEQNLGESRDEKDFVIGPWNSWGAPHHKFMKEYDSWLRDIAYNLNHPSGK